MFVWRKEDNAVVLQWQTMEGVNLYKGRNLPSKYLFNGQYIQPFNV